MDAPLDPDTMSLDQLRAEAWFWRENAAASLLFMLVDIDRKGAGGTFKSRRALKLQAKQLTDQLAAALSGEVFDLCGICDAPLIPGQAALRDATEGEVHAHCLGTPVALFGRPTQPGDLVQLDPESIVDENDDPIPGHDGRLTAFAVARLFTLYELVEKVAVARKALANG